MSQVAAMLLLCSELYLNSRSPRSPRLDPGRADAGKGSRYCRECGRESRGDVCERCEAALRAPAVHADVLQGLGLTHIEWEDLAVGLADLDAAMSLISPRARQGVSDFIRVGPERIEARYVEFRYGQAGYVSTVWRAINRRGEFEGVKSDSSRAHEGDIPEVPPAAA